MASVTVRETTADMVWPLRARVLRPGKPLEAAMRPDDHHADTFHLAAFDEAGAVIGVLSCLRAAPPGSEEHLACQMRSVAVAPEWQRHGIGRRLVERSSAMAGQRGYALLWCNARATAVDFYKTLGFSVVSDAFEVKLIGPHYRMQKRLEPAGQ